jgi:hypothetical protein
MAVAKSRLLLEFCLYYKKRFAGQTIRILKYLEDSQIDEIR